MIIFAKLNAHLVLTYIAAQTRLQYKYKFRESDEKKKNNRIRYQSKDVLLS